MASLRAKVANVSILAATLAIPVARGAAAADGVEDQAAEHAEVAASGGIFCRVSVVESDGSDVIPVTLCHSPATYIAHRERDKNEESLIFLILIFRLCVFCFSRFECVSEREQYLLVHVVASL